MGELVAANLPVPPGFVLLRDCFRDSMRSGGVDAELNALHREALDNVADTARLTERCERMQGLVHKAGVDDAVRRLMLPAYRALGHGAVVAVRSSATGEDGADASFAGMNATITNVTRRGRARRRGDPLLDVAVQPAGHHLPRHSRLHRRPRDGRCRAADGGVREGRRRVHRRPEQRCAGPSGHRGRLRPRRGGGVRRGRARHLHRLQGKPPAAAYPARATRHSRSSAARTATTRPSTSTTRRPTPGCSATRSCGRSPSSRSRPNGTTARPQDTEWAIAGGKTYLVQARPDHDARPHHTTAGREARGARPRAGRRARARRRARSGSSARPTRVSGCRKARSSSRR